MTGRGMLVAATTMLVAASAAASDTADTAAQRFGAREDVRQVSLSPDGKRIAMLRTVKGAATVLMVADLAADATPKPVLTSSGRPDQLYGCDWATATRLVCTISTTLMRDGRSLGYSRVLTLDADGRNVRELSGETPDAIGGAAQYGGGVIDLLGEDGGDRSGAGGAVLMTRMFGEQMRTGSLLASTQRGLGVERVDTGSLKRQIVEQPRDTASEYISDGHGAVRVMGLMTTTDDGMLRGRTAYLYRKPDARAWLPLSAVTTDGVQRTGFDPVAVDRDLDVVYGFDQQNGRKALFKVALDGSLKREVVLDNPAVDVDGLIRIGRQHRVVGASFATDKRQATYFDPSIKALTASLGRALPGSPTIDVVDASADEQRLILLAGGDTDPGHYYLFDKPTRELSEIAAVRPQLAGVALSPQKPISFRAADGTMVPAYLTLPPGSEGPNGGKGLPAIVMPHGGPEARDEWGFDWLVQFFANRGYAVLQPNYRGSTGYGAEWFQKNGFQSWRTAIGDVNDAGRYLLSSGIAAPGKLAIVGWSYGGYAALQSAVLDPDLFKAIVAVAPVTDLEVLRGESRDYTNAAIEDARIGHGPHVREGSPAQNAGRITAPVLLFHGDQDRNVGVGQSRLMASRLRSAGRKVDYVEYKGLTHQLDDSEARADLLGKSDAFLRKALDVKG